MPSSTSLGPLFDLQLAMELKQEGIALALQNAGDSFVERACSVIQELHSGQVILAETWRETCVEHGITPHHANAWGALTSSLRKRGIIHDTGTYKTAKSVKNHGHTYRLWKVT